MQKSKIILVIGIIEIFIGGITLITTLTSLFLSINQKAPNVLIFVLITALLSMIIGIELMRLNRMAYQALLYFSSVIVFSKILIFFGIIELNGSLTTMLPGSFKNAVSILYHSSIIYFLTHSDIKKYFHS